MSKLIERFFSKIEKIPFHECWEWTGEIKPEGYGIIREKRTKKIYVHRLSYEIHKGQIPKGFYVCHKCDNRSCVNPEHLFAGTPTDNNHDMFKKGRNSAIKLNEHKVKEIKKLINEGNISLRKIAKIYGVHHINISKIKNGIVWKHV